MKYISYFDFEFEKECKNPAGTNKAIYISKSLKQIGCDFEIVSCFQKPRHLKGKNIYLDDDILIDGIDDNISSNNFIMRKFITLYKRLRLYTFLFCKIKRNETIILYHTLNLVGFISFVRKLKKFKLILEVEEFYNDLIDEGKNKKNRELKFIQGADGYVFSTVGLKDRCNIKNKPYAVANGEYIPVGLPINKFDDNKIHLLYSGIIDEYKKGAFYSVQTALYLDNNYVMHISGKGDENSVSKLVALINKVNSKGKCNVIYEGFLDNKEYETLLSKCKIGLCTQNSEGIFNKTCFQSKMLKYICCGLYAVAADIEVNRKSSIGQVLIYFKNQTVKSIADAIKNIDFSADYKPQEKIVELHIEFCNSLKKLLK